MSFIKVFLIYVVVVNLVTFLLYGVDKRKAQKNKWRISEKTLLGAALAGGSVGALFGMHVFRHKTKHWKFKIGVPSCLIFHMALLYLYCAK